MGSCIIRSCFSNRRRGQTVTRIFFFFFFFFIFILLSQLSIQLRGVGQSVAGNQAPLLCLAFQGGCGSPSCSKLLQGLCGEICAYFAQREGVIGDCGSNRFKYDRGTIEVQDILHSSKSVYCRSASHAAKLQGIQPARDFVSQMCRRALQVH